MIAFPLLPAVFSNIPARSQIRIKSSKVSDSFGNTDVVVPTPGPGPVAYSLNIFRIQRPSAGREEELLEEEVETTLLKGLYESE